MESRHMRWMALVRWKALVLGVATVALGVSVAEAKMVRYEVNGQRFSYSTGDRAQFELARQRINAANAAVAARAKANAELAANPLVRAFGSQSQNEAKAAEANLTRARLGRDADGRGARAGGRLAGAPESA